MTNQEAIKRIKEHIVIHKYSEPHAIHIIEALNMAISALEERDVPDTNVGDMISRQAAIDEVLNLNVENRVSWRDAVIDTIDALPSAQPEIVMCNDCLMHGVCRFEQGLGLDGYCSQAERRTDGSD